jgi:hypothetical protein
MNIKILVIIQSDKNIKPRIEHGKIKLFIWEILFNAQHIRVSSV